MTAAETYLEKLLAMLEKIRAEEMDKLEQAAQRIADALASGGVVYTFGTGHGHLLAEEIFYRAGGMACVTPMLDERLMLHVSASASTRWERQEGVAAQVLCGYPVKPGDVIIISSNSGRNAAPVEMALAAKKQGAYVIALTNMRHSAAATPRNRAGRRLFECADLVLDNGGCIGDAAVETALGRTGPTSTATGAAILQAIVCRVAEIAAARGLKPDFYASSNVDGGDAINDRLVEKYRVVNRHL